MTAEQDHGAMSKDTDPNSGNLTWSDYWEQGMTMWRFNEIYWPLEKYLQRLTSGKPSVFYVPMCGDMVDMKWLMDRGHTVIGVEIAERAAINFFRDQKIEYTKEDVPGYGLLYKSKDGLMRFYVGDVLTFSSKIAGCKVDCAYDVGAMQALDEGHDKYADVLCDMLKDDGQVLIDLMGFFSGETEVDPHEDYPETMKKPYDALVKKFNVGKVEVYEQSFNKHQAGSNEKVAEMAQDHDGFSTWNWFYICTKK